MLAAQLVSPGPKTLVLLLNYTLAVSLQALVRTSKTLVSPKISLVLVQF